MVIDDDVHNLFGRHKEKYLINIQYEMTAPEGESGAAQSPGQSGLLETSKKRRRGERHGRSGSSQQKKVNVQPKKDPASSSPVPHLPKIKPSLALALSPKKKTKLQDKEKGKGKGKEQEEP